MATYPDDAIAPVTAFGVVASALFLLQELSKQILIYHQLLVIRRSCSDR